MVEDTQLANNRRLEKFEKEIDWIVASVKSLSLCSLKENKTKPELFSFIEIK